MITKMVELESNNIVDDNIEKLKKLFPDIVKDGKIDFDTLKLVLGEEIEKDKESYKFEWSGKTDCYKTVQSPSLGTLKPQKEESIDFDNTENIIIEGDNLEVLKLLQSTYGKNGGQIKMIYIDPPYNTGNDFVYPDNYETPLDNYFELTGQKIKGEDTQSKKSKEGRKHTQWLNMIFPRLLLSRTLLKEDGVIFISIDDNEYDNLKKLCDEIFGEENFICNFVWKSKLGKVGTTSTISTTHEYILVYSKNSNLVSFKMIEKLNKNRKENLRQWGQSDRREDRPSMYFPITINDKTVYPMKTDGTEGRWRVGQEKVNKLLSQNFLEVVEDNGNYSIYRKFPDDISKTPHDTLLIDIGTTSKGTLLLKELGLQNYFDYPKPTTLIKHFIDLNTNKNDIVLDFFGGSGTTGHSVLELNKEDKGNRKFILVQLPEKTNNPDYPTICDITKERIRRVIQGYGDNPKPMNDGFKVFKLDKSNYVVNEKLSIKPNITDTDRQDLITKLRKQFESSTIHDECLTKDYKQLDVVYEVILKEGYSLNSKIEEIKILNINIYKVIDGSKKCYISFDDIDTTITKDKEFKGIPKDTLFVCLDKGLTDSDKSNLSLSFQLKTI